MTCDRRPPLVSIVGRSGVGKTYLLERVIPELKKHGYKIAVIKHHPHEFEIDVPGKDTWRYLQAGSDAAIISGPEKIGYIKKVDHDSKLSELIAIVGNDYDIIIAEGFKKELSQKIEVHRAQFGKD
ncbi:MAG: molybdopterin-guanine dinucleotide biosynthesis protein B, partial [Chloroflexi bacterium]|nr:molybdopterin-guanine dinucleotide biosynthesis protein B [Chloroflexota bacterium]